MRNWLDDIIVTHLFCTSNSISTFPVFSSMQPPLLYTPKLQNSAGMGLASPWQPSKCSTKVCNLMGGGLMTTPIFQPSVLEMENQLDHPPPPHHHQYWGKREETIYFYPH